MDLEYTLIDCATGLIYGPYETFLQARERADFVSATGFSFAGLGGRRPRRAASVVTAASSIDFHIIQPSMRGVKVISPHRPDDQRATIYDSLLLAHV